MPPKSKKRSVAETESAAASSGASSAAASAQANEAPTQVAKLSPQAAWSKKVVEAIKASDTNSYMIIVGVSDDGDDSDDEGEKKECTESEMDAVRIVLLNDHRRHMLKKYLKLATAGQQDDCVQMFNTATGSHIVMAICRAIRTISRMKQLPKKFDAMLMLTKAICDNDCWMYDNDLSGDSGVEQDDTIGVVRGLSKAWKALWRKSDNELGMVNDPFSRAGVQALLEELAKKFEALPDLHELPPLKWE